MMGCRVIVADFDSWTGSAYLRCGSGSLRKRLISSAIRLFAFRLKPSQAPLK